MRNGNGLRLKKMGTIQVNIQEAKTQLSKLIQAALDGK